MLFLIDPETFLWEYLLLILRSLFIHLLIYFFIHSLSDYLRVLLCAGAVDSCKEIK